MINYFTITPPASLSRYVRCFWVLESTLPAYTHRSMADVCCEMVFHYNGQFTEMKGGRSELASLTAIHGPSEHIRRFHIEQSFGIFGVYFYPFAIPAFFGVPSLELSNQMPDLPAFMQTEGRVLEEQMIIAKDNGQRVRIITHYLESKLAKHREPEHRVCSSIEFMIQNRGGGKIEQLADQYFLSKRQFERSFKEYAGLTPKLFSRIVRFHAACAHYGANNQSLTSIAYACGYYDQSHFIHDFKKFSGYHPKTFFHGKAEGTEWRN